MNRRSGSLGRTAIERRRAIRYPLQFPAFFSWEDEQGIAQQGEGHTRNVSENGAFVDAAILPPVGSSVELDFSLPPFPDAEREMHIRYTGETLRREKTEQGDGFAIASHEIVWRYQDGKDRHLSDEDENQKR